MRIIDWSSDVCSSDLDQSDRFEVAVHHAHSYRASTAVGDIQATSGDSFRFETGAGLETPLAWEAGNWRESSSQTLATSNPRRSEENTSELQALIRISNDVFCLHNKHIHVKTTDLKY